MEEGATTVMAQKKIELATDAKLPIDIVTESIAILAIKRAGKSTTARRLVEQLYYADQQCVVVDPKGDWWGLLYGRDGKSPGLPFVVLGGEHGHVPLTGDFQKTGEIVARMAAVERVNMVIDLSEPRKHEVTKFMTFFLESLYRLKAKDEYRTPMMLCIDEADVVAPQRPVSTEGKLEPRMLGAAEDIVRRGGQRGIGVALITQRSAVLNKNVLTQCGVLVLLRMVAEQDIDPINDWVEKHGTAEQAETCISSLPSMPTGSAWLWSSHFPAPNGIFKRVDIELPDTFDSSATPKVGEKPVMPKNAADVDMAAFQREMAETIEKAKAEDPKELRRRIHELEAQIRKGAVPSSGADLKRVEKELGVMQGLEKDWEKQFADMAAEIKRLNQELRARQKFQTRFTQVLSKIGELAASVDGQAPVVVHEEGVELSPKWIRPKAHPPAHEVSRMPQKPSAPVQRGNPWPQVSSDVGMSQMQRSMLIALAQHPKGLTKAQVLLHTGYASSGSTSSAFAELGRAGWVSSPSANSLKIAEAGLAALGAFDPLPLGAELREWLLKGDKLSTMEKALLRQICDAYPDSIGKGEILEKANYASSGSTSSAFARLVRYGYAVPAGSNQLQASDALFEE